MFEYKVCTHAYKEVLDHHWQIHCSCLCLLLNKNTVQTSHVT